MLLPSSDTGMKNGGISMMEHVSSFANLSFDP